MEKVERFKWSYVLYTAVPLALYFTLIYVKPKLVFQYPGYPSTPTPVPPEETTTPAPAPSPAPTTIPSEAQPFVDAASKIEQIDSMTGPQAVETLIEVSRTLRDNYNNLLMIALNKTINRVNADNQAYPTQDLKNQVISTITSMINRIVVRV
jgi:hypothetical protein